MLTKKYSLIAIVLRLFYATGCLVFILGHFQGNGEVFAQEPPPRRVNIPHYEDGVPWEQTAIFWFGENEQGVPSKNYVDVRAGYTDWSLQIQVTVIDYYLWYNNNPTPTDDLTQYEAVAIYLDTNQDRASSPQMDDYRFLVGTHLTGYDAINYSRQAQGDGDNWNAGWAPSTDWREYSRMDWACNPGPNSNTCGIDYGWRTILAIPWQTMGLSGPPPEGTLLGLGVQLYDRDDEPPAGYVAPEYWPETFDANNPSTWGELHLGYANYQPPSITPEGTAMIRAASPVDNTVEDAWVGGGSLGTGGHLGGSEVNHGDDPNLYVGSETAPTHFPFFNKSYLRFSLDDIPPGKEIISATLTLQHWGNSGQGSGLARPSWVSLFTISDPWDEMTIHWNNAPLAQENIAATWIYPLFSWPGWDNVPFYHWDATQAVAEAHAADEPVSLAIYSSDDARDTSKYLTSSETGINDDPAHWNWNEEGRPTLTVLWGEANFDFEATPTFQTIDAGEAATYTVQIQHSNDFTHTVSVIAGSPSPSLTVNLDSNTFPSPGGQTTLTLTDLHDSSFTGGIWYSIPLTATSNNITMTTAVNLLVNGEQIYLPLVIK